MARSVRQLKKKPARVPGSTGKTPTAKTAVKSDTPPSKGPKRAMAGRKPGVVLPGATGQNANAPKSGSQAKRRPGPVKKMDAANGIFQGADAGNASLTAAGTRTKRVDQGFELGPRRQGKGGSGVGYRRASR